MQPAFKSKPGFDERPLVAIWEVTQACDLACVHCRASAQPFRHPFELTTLEAQHLIQEIADMRVPIFVLTGGDPLKRPDIFAIVEYAARKGVRPALTPSATALLTKEAVFDLKRCGLKRLAVSLDGSCPEVHDGIRGISGSFQRTLDSIQWANECGLPLQVNTVVSRRNLPDLPELLKVLEKSRIVLWSVFFLVPTGRGQAADLLAGAEFEEVFGFLYRASKQVEFHIKTTEAQHYRRYVIQQKAQEKLRGEASAEVEGDGEGDVPASIPEMLSRSRPGVNDAKGFVFVSHVGEVYPSGFLPLSAGNVRRQTLGEIYRESPLFVALRDPDRLKGKCRQCEFRQLCGGSRARAFALTGDPLGEEPCCTYQPGGWQEMQQAAMLAQAAASAD